MAEVIDTFKFNGRGSPYPWNEWLDGRIWKLRSGVDFKVPAGNFCSCLFMAGKRFGKKVRANRIVEDGVVYVVLQAYTADDNCKASE